MTDALTREASIDLLDLAGPAQVFSEADDCGHPYTVHFVADQAEVVSAQGLPVRAETTWPHLDAADLIVVPGWRSSGASGPGGSWGVSGAGEEVALRPSTLQRLVDHHARGGMVASVCAGAFALGRAGLLDGRRCTTHHELQAALARCFPRAQVIPDVLFVADGRVITSAGIASGIDLALHLLARWHGPVVAAAVARALVVYTRRNGQEPQASAMLRHRDHLSDAVHRAQDILDAQYTQALPLPELAARVGVSERTLTRRFTAAAGLTPLRYQQELRLEQAEHLIGHGLGQDAAARAVGFTDARMLRRLRRSRGG